MRPGWPERLWYDQDGRLRGSYDVSGMRIPARCTRCGTVYDLQGVHMTGRFSDCSVWRCPGCGVTCDDRPPGWGDHHYVELDQYAREKREQ